MNGISGYGYRCAAGESFDSVALVLFGDEKYAADIMRVNPELIGRLVFDGSEELRVPLVNLPDDDAEADAEAPHTAPWKE